MPLYIARHGVSRANDHNDPAFGTPNADLLKAGVDQAVSMGEKFEHLGFDRPETPVAVSYMKRSQQTALAAGFHILKPYRLLNELDLTPAEKMAAKYSHRLPLESLQQTEALLNNPPQEKIWHTHGLRAACIFKILDIYQDADDPFIMSFCEIREIPIGQSGN